ncbi:hypothetical protein BTW28_06540 [Citrobacter freundii]|nr:hypothetical protein BTW28_06540 [Citrobacter freundii]
MVFYPSYFKLYVRWLHSLTPVTYFCKLLRIPSFAAFLQLELSRVPINNWPKPRGFDLVFEEVI